MRDEPCLPLMPSHSRPYLSCRIPANNPHAAQLLGIMFFGALLSSIAAVIQRASKAARRWVGTRGHACHMVPAGNARLAACLLQIMPYALWILHLQGPGAAG